MTEIAMELWLYDVWLVPGWDVEEEVVVGDDAAIVYLAGTNRRRVAEDLRDSWAHLAPRYYGPGVVVVTDTQGKRVGPVRPTVGQQRQQAVPAGSGLTVFRHKSR